MRALLLTAATFAATFTQAQTQDHIVDNFDITPDVERESLGWSQWWGGAGQTYSLDTTVDANNGATSGSLKAEIAFDSTGTDNQFALIGVFTNGLTGESATNLTLNGTQYTNLVMDLRWDAASPTRTSGDFGLLEIGFRGPNFSQIWLTNYTVPASATDWTRLVIPINPALSGIDRVNGIVLKMWAGANLNGTSTFWVDNVHLEGRSDSTVPQPTLFIEKAEPGLEVFASGTGQYQRQNIRTVDTSQSWVGATGPVTYSFTIADYPDATHSGFQTHLFLVPGDNLPTWEASPDWGQPNVVFLDLQNSADGGAYATFRHKTNSANSNTMIYNGNPDSGAVGALAGIGATDIRGTWSLTFSNDTSVTITTPQGTSTNFTISAETAALFANPMYAYLGVQPNRLENLGQSARFTSFNITGTTTPITENFVGVVPEETPDAAPNLDPAIWLRVAENAAGVTLVPTNSTYVVSWTVPAVGFKLQHSASLSPQQWEDVTTPAVQIGDRVRTTLSTSGQTGFFRLIKP